MPGIDDPFGNESEALDIAGLTVENRVDRVSIFGSTDIPRDQEGLERALTLKAVIDAIVTKLQAEDLPAEVATGGIVDKVDNPF
jgi:hypothetical protein